MKNMLEEFPLHPALVHFPIALLLTGWLADLAGLIVKKSWLFHTAFLLLVLGTLGAVAAVRSGEAEEDRILETPAIHEVLEEHEESGKLVMWFFLVSTAARAGMVWWGKPRPGMHLIFVLIWAVGLVLVVRTAYYGGEMVFRHGAGVAAVEAATGSRAPVSPQPPGSP
jgi:uncharacterized membrane protein